MNVKLWYSIESNSGSEKQKPNVMRTYPLGLNQIFTWCEGPTMIEE